MQLDVGRFQNFAGNKSVQDLSEQGTYFFIRNSFIESTSLDILI